MAGVSESVCSIHKMRLDRECATHKMQICSGCDIVDHKNCQILGPQIPLQSFLLSISTVSELIECQLYMLGKDKEKASDTVKERCRLYKDFIEKLERRSLQDIENGFHKQATQLCELKSKFASSLKMKSDVEETKNTTNDVLKSCLISKLTAIEKEPQIALLSEMAANFLKRETPSYLLKFEVSETFEKAISENESLGEVSLPDLIGNTHVSEKRLLRDSDYKGNLPMNPTAPLNFDLPSYEEIIEGQDTKEEIGVNPHYNVSTHVLHDTVNPTTVATGYSVPQPSVPAPYQSIGVSGKYMAFHPQTHNQPYTDLPMGCQEYVHPFHESAAKQSTTPNVLSSFESAPSTPPKQLKFLSNIHPRYIDESEGAEISGVTFLANEHIVISDKANQSIKMYDDMNILLVHRKLEHKPYDVTQSPRGDIAVAVPKDHRVIFLRSHDLSTVPNQWINNPKAKCYGLASSDCYIFVIWKENDASDSIRIYNENHSEIRKIGLSVERYLVVNPTTQDLFYRVLNFGNDQIKCTNAFSDKKTKWKVKVPAPTIEGLALLKSGIIVSSQVWVQFVDWSDQHFTPLLDLRNGKHITVNRSRSKIALVVNEASPFDDKDDVVQIYDIIY